MVASAPMHVAVMLKRDFRHMEADLPEVADMVRRAIEERS